jgi:AraC family transcriptional regulator
VQRFLDGIAYIEAHLLEPLALEDVARAGHLSPYHFARSFRAIVGETVMGYVRRRRLAYAAEQIATGGVRLIDIALEVQFDSQEAFTRAFKRQYGMAPGEWGRGGHVLFAHQRAVPDSLFLRHRKENIDMEPTFKEVGEIKVVGMMATFTDENKHGIPDLWSKFAPRMGEIAQRVDGVTYGVCFPATLNGEGFEYMAAIGVENFNDIPDGMVGRTIPSHRYAVFTHRTGEDTLHNDIQKTAHYIWGVWLPNSKFEQAPSADFELYDERFDPLTAKGEIDFYIPLK